MQSRFHKSCFNMNFSWETAQQFWSLQVQFAHEQEKIIFDVNNYFSVILGRVHETIYALTESTWTDGLVLKTTSKPSEVTEKSCLSISLYSHFLFFFLPSPFVWWVFTFSTTAKIWLYCCLLTISWLLRAFYFIILFSYDERCEKYFCLGCAEHKCWRPTS